MVEMIINNIPQKQRVTPRKRTPKKRLYNRNPAVNAMLIEEEGNDNYADLADFIDPTPDLSLQELGFHFK